MNEILNKLLLQEISLCLKYISDSLDLHIVIVNHFQKIKKNKKRIQKFKGTRNSRYIYKNELNEACFQHDMADENFKDLTRRTASDKILGDKVFSIAKDPKYD